jgi:hypothetical protein
MGATALNRRHINAASVGGHFHSLLRLSPSLIGDIANEDILDICGGGWTPFLNRLRIL